MAHSLYTEEEYRKAAIIWRKENPDVEMIPTKTVIKIKSGKAIPIGGRLVRMRRNLDKLDEEQKEFWAHYGLYATNQATKDKYTEEEYRKAALLWRKENPGIEMIPHKTVIKITNGKEVPVGRRMNTMRLNPELLTDEQKEFWTYYGLFATNQANQDKYTEEEYREAALLWRKENPTKEVIPTKTVIKITNGKKVPLGRRMNTMRTNPEILSNKRKEFWEDFGLSKDAKRGRKSEKQKQQSVLKEYENLFDGDKEKAERVIKTIQDIRQKRKTNQKEEIKVETILKEFEIDIKYLINCLTKTKKQDARPTKPLLEFQGKTLKQFCIENKFNYDVINRAIRLHQIGINGTLEELINREIVNYKKEPATWIYEKYGNLIKPILDYLQLDSKIILMEMTRNQITLEEALKNEIFEKQKETKENSWLKELYEYLIEEKKLEKIEDNFIRLVKDYHLEQDEIHILWNSFSEYEKTIKEYQLVSIGLETDEQRKLEKIKEYKLGSEDIEETFFIPLEFDQNLLLGRKSELYKRRQLLRQYIIDWDYYTEQEKKQIIIQNKFTEEELDKIEKTRKEINDTIIKTK